MNTINLMIIGHGRMGQQIADTIKYIDDMQVILMADRLTYPNLHTLTMHPNAIIDFSHPDNLNWIIDYIKQEKCAYICGTTGYNRTQIHKIKQLGKSIPVVFQSNFSPGIVVLEEIVSLITPVLYNDFDIEIIEKHHKNKTDAPSGTAKTLVNLIDQKHIFQKTYGRCGLKKRTNEIGIHSIRGGTAVGEHSVLYMGDHECLEIRHTAESRQIFVNGAITATRFAITQPPGIYTMKDILFPKNKME